MAKRERGAGRVYLRQDPTDPERRLQTWWIDYHVDGRRYRESSKSRKKSDALALLKLRMGEHATGQYVGAEAKRLTFENLEAGVVASYELKGHRSLDRLGSNAASSGGLVGDNVTQRAAALSGLTRVQLREYLVEIRRVAGLPDSVALDELDTLAWGLSEAIAAALLGQVHGPAYGRRMRCGIGR